MLTTIKQAALTLLSLTALALMARAQELELITPENVPTWQKETAKGFLAYHRLTTLDFPVKRDAGNIAFMIQPFLHCYYSIESRPAANGLVYCYVTNWKVFSGFDRNKSWRNAKADMKVVLPYAQALLDLAEIRARQFGALKEGDLPSAQGTTVEEAQFHLQDAVAAFNHKHFWDMQKELEGFVEATKQGRDQQQITKLGAEIRKRLAAVPATNPHPATADGEH
jgi:hypothetical protein